MILTHTHPHKHTPIFISFWILFDHMLMTLSLSLLPDKRKKAHRRLSRTESEDGGPT